MIGRSSTTDQLKESAVNGKDLAAQLARDRTFRKQVVSAVTHGDRARRRARRNVGLVGVVSRLAADTELRDELDQMSRELRRAWRRVESKRSHRIRNGLLVAAALGGAAAWAFPQLKSLFAGSEPDDR